LSENIKLFATVGSVDIIGLLVLPPFYVIRKVPLDCVSMYL